MIFRGVRPALAIGSAAVLLTACGASSSTGESSTGSGSKTLNVVTSFYPLQFAAQQVGGSHVAVSSLTAPGVEPHDLELTPKQAGSVAEAGLMIYLKGFQPSVDAAAAMTKSAFDVSSIADLSLHADDTTTIDGASADEHDHGAADPHFWLDPVRYSAVVTAIGEKFAAKDPAHASEFRANAKKLTDELSTLNQDYRSTLKTCSNKNLVTGHTAFGYLAQRYGLTQVGVSSLSPDQEPTPGRLQAVASFVRSHHVTTVYTETLASPAVTETVARETGAKVAVLDPLEGITDKSAGRDYLAVMRSNLDTLKKGQQCQ